MARAAVKAKAKQSQRGAQQAKAAPRRVRGRRRHAGGGNPNQQLFFMRLRRQAKYAYVILAVLFAVTFAFLGVGSGSSGLDQLFQGINPFHHGGTSVSKALNEVKKRPNDAKGYRDAATAYEAKNDTANVITYLQQYLNLKPKDAAAWSELGGWQMKNAQDLTTQYYDAAQANVAAAPTKALLPTSGTAQQWLSNNPFEQAASSSTSSNLSDLGQRAQLAANNAIDSYKKVTELQPHNSDGWLTLGQNAQQVNDATTAVSAYKHYLKLNPTSPNATTIRQLIKQLSPAPAAPKNKKK